MGAIFLCFRSGGAGGCGGVKPPPYGAIDTWAVMARLRAGHARPLRTAVSGNGGSGALGGAQRAPPVCFANTLVRLFAPQGQTLLAPQFRCAQLWPHAHNPAPRRNSGSFLCELSFAAKRKRVSGRLPLMVRFTQILHNIYLPVVVYLRRIHYNRRRYSVKLNKRMDV